MKTQTAQCGPAYRAPAPHPTRFARKNSVIARDRKRNEEELKAKWGIARQCRTPRYSKSVVKVG